MTNDKITQAATYGFLKRAMEHGSTEMEARAILAKNAGILEDITAGVKNHLEPQLDPNRYAEVQNRLQNLSKGVAGGGAALGGISAGLGGLIGAGAGALGGHLMGGTDEEKSKRRWQGAALGGGLGAIGGGAFGGAGAGSLGFGGGLGVSARNPEISAFLNQTAAKR